jgi:hypothetical protein
VAAGLLFRGRARQLAYEQPYPVYRR